MKVNIWIASSEHFRYYNFIGIWLGSSHDRSCFYSKAWRVRTESLSLKTSLRPFIRYDWVKWSRASIKSQWKTYTTCVHVDWLTIAERVTTNWTIMITSLCSNHDRNHVVHFQRGRINKEIVTSWIRKQITFLTRVWSSYRLFPGNHQSLSSLFKITF